MSNMNDADSISVRLEELEQRTKRLRKDSRELKIAFLLLAIAILALGAFEFVIGKRFGIVTDGFVQTPRLIVVNDAGDRRAELGTSAAGVPHLTLFDASGRPRLIATQSDDRVRLRLIDRDRREAELQLVDDGEQSLSFTEKDRSRRIALGRSADGDAGLHLLGPTEQPRVTLSACKAGDSGLSVFDQTEVVRLAAGVGKDGIPLLNVLDEGGQARIILGQSPEGWPALDMVASDGSTRVGLHAPDEWTCLTLRGPRGEATAKTCVDEVGLARAVFHDPDGGLIWSTPPEWYASLLYKRFRESARQNENAEPSE